ncbi:MAG: flagellar basal body rod protein FlgB [Oscillospiraceae bacterium]|nr:flagellar basal body rod protein FlgB [Oscillospiraceae bacterium]
MNFLSTANFELMRKNLDVLTQRMELTAQNISNVNTPDYKAKKLEFENLLAQGLEKKTDMYAWRMRCKSAGDDQNKKNRLEKIIESTSPQVVTDETTEMKVDRNNVDIDHENLELARTQIQYNYMIRKITDEYNLLKHAINEGK